MNTIDRSLPIGKNAKKDSENIKNKKALSSYQPKNGKTITNLSKEYSTNINYIKSDVEKSFILNTFINYTREINNTISFINRLKELEAKLSMEDNDKNKELMIENFFNQHKDFKINKNFSSGITLKDKFRKLVIFYDKYLKRLHSTLQNIDSVANYEKLNTQKLLSRTIESMKNIHNPNYNPLSKIDTEKIIKLLDT